MLGQAPQTARPWRRVAPCARTGATNPAMLRVAPYMSGTPCVQSDVRCHALPPLRQAQEQLAELQRRVASAAAAAACSAALLLAPPAISAEGGTVIRLPASENPEIFTAQQTMVEAWQIVGEAFFDGNFGGHSWTDELRTHMLAAYQSPDGRAAYREIAAMLEDLGDPYTRLLPPEEYQEFVVSSNGEMQGVGILIANEPVEGHLLVLAPIRGSPADRAGIKPGDIVTAINGHDTSGWTGEEAAKHLRGEGGTQVSVRLVRHSDAIPGVAGRPPPPANRIVDDPLDREMEVSLTRERVELSPVFHAALPGPKGERIGYLKLAAFSQNAGQAVRDAIRDLKGVDGYVLDLRSNPGGLVQSAADVARVFMDGHPTLFTVSGRSGEQLQEVVLEEGDSETAAPLAVLVDKGSASASEILSGALRDNRRAVVVGDNNTYGKGRIQSVFELDDGSALFVTVARYRTPGGSEIDLRGIRPDMACSPPLVAAAPRRGAAPAMATAATLGLAEEGPGAVAGSAAEIGAKSMDGLDLSEVGLDAIRLEGMVGGLVPGPKVDRCLMTAMSVLADKSALIDATAGATVARAP